MRYTFLALIAAVLLIFVSTGCSILQKTDKIYSAEESETQTGPYLRLLQVEMSKRGINMAYPMGFRVYIAKDLNKVYKDVAGLCRLRSNKIRVLIDKDIWDHTDDIGREMLMFHELGHCALALPHNNATAPNGQPYSLMYGKLFDPYLYATYRNQYLDQMANEFHALYTPKFNLEDLLNGLKYQTNTYILRIGKEFKDAYLKN